jgi:spore coat protein U-like protein
MSKFARTIKNVATSGAALCVLMNTAGVGLAAQVNDGFDVTIKVESTCNVSVDDIDFGDVTEVLKDTIVDAAIVAYCSLGTPFLLTFDPAGTLQLQTTGNMSGAIAGNTDTIPYRLNIQGGATPNGQGLANPINRNIRGRITANVNATPDSYSETRTLYLFF